MNFMKIDKEEYYKMMLKEGIRIGLESQKEKEKRLKEYVKNRVDDLIYKILDDNMYKFEYKDRMHKEILKELLDEI